MNKKLVSVARMVGSSTWVAALLVAGCAIEQESPQAQALQEQTPGTAAPRPATKPGSAVARSAATSAPVASGLQVDPALPAYRPAQIVSGPLRSVGSDTMDRLMSLWEAELHKTHPGLIVHHEGKGSGTAPPALLKGLSDLGPMSRPLTVDEIAAFSQRFNHPPVQLQVAIDALGVFVHPSNPLAKKGLDLRQVDAIFSATRKRGGNEVTTWGQLGLGGEWADKPIVVYSRNKASGTYAFFREHVLNKGDFRQTNHELAGSEDVVRSVAADPYAIGFASVGYATPAVATMPLSANPGEALVNCSSEMVYAGKYPLSRALYLTLNYGPEDPLTPATQEFIRLVFSQEGQAKVLKERMFPLPASVVEKELAKVAVAP